VLFRSTTHNTHTIKQTAEMFPIKQQTNLLLLLLASTTTPTIFSLSLPHLEQQHQLQFESEPLVDWTWVPTPSNVSASLLGFSWSSCGSSSDIATLNHLSVVPDPLALPGNVTGFADGSLSKDLVAPLKTSLKLYKKALIWVEIPCVSGLGSCTYDDVCQLLEKVAIPDCPIASCKCPFPAGFYNVSQGLTVSVSVPSSIPSWAASGEYKVDVSVTDSASERVTCLELVINLKFNSKEEEDLETELNNLESCDPNGFSYTVCNLTSPVCPAGQSCKRLRCPFPECNAEDCGLCEDKAEQSPFSSQPRFVQTPVMTQKKEFGFRQLKSNLEQKQSQGDLEKLHV